MTSPVRPVSSGCLKIPLRLKRSPHSGGGVASSRIRWRCRPLRTTASTWLKASGGAWRISSVQRTVPPRTTNSICEKNQSATALWPVSLSLDTSSPPTKIFPSAARRISSSGRSITSCSKPSPHSEAGDSAPTTRGRRTASRPWLSSNVTSFSSNEGIAPSERPVIWPMRTGTPNALLACCSSCGRNSAIRGTIQPWSTHQLSPKTSQADATSHSRPRIVRATHRRRRDGRTGKSDGRVGVGSIDLGIMTADGNRRLAQNHEVCEVV